MEFWLKFGHISAMSLWFTGLFFLPRLFAARHRGERDARMAYFSPVAGALYFRVMSPAALVTIAFGIALIATAPGGAWLPLKLFVVLLAIVVHVYIGVVMFELERGRDRHGAGFYRVLGALPLLLLLGIAALTGAKPRTAGPLPAPPGAQHAAPVAGAVHSLPAGSQGGAAASSSP